jgi:hypothetical protein
LKSCNRQAGFAPSWATESRGAKVNEFLLLNAQAQKTPDAFFEHYHNGYRPFDPAAHDGFADMFISFSGQPGIGLVAIG